MVGWAIGRENETEELEVELKEEQEVMGSIEERGFWLANLSQGFPVAGMAYRGLVIVLQAER